MIAIVDFDMGNVGSIQNMLSRIGVEGIVTNSVDEIVCVMFFGAIVSEIVGLSI
jgi:imidazoleglycerol phosphate synthase glutamine amidotransferase subunit HisH